MIVQSHGDLLILFAKSPRGKNVKTRLHDQLSLRDRQGLQEALIRDTLSLSTSLPIKRVLACAPKIEDPFFKQCQKQYGIDLIAQEGSHLGLRMKNAFQWGFDRGFQRIALIGTDSPTLPASFIREAFRRLRTVPVVLGPALDGGYYLIGMRNNPVPFPPIFKGIRWGSKTVLTETLKRLSSYDLLPFWYDLDRPSDLDFLNVHLKFLRQQEDCARETWKRIKSR